ncbi:transient receptor potential protein-like [Chelonus insularis]|uniref:transient receptor potential protein-like n=1 Tax=Chelonus insularis TaxID=460826 RepID=UPI00158D5F86|nr:transient receptor potential protein-like [Chelonus insularis]
MKISILGSLLLLSFAVLVTSQDDKASDDKGIEEVKKFIMDLIKSSDLDKAEKEALEKLLPLDGDKKKAAMDLVDRLKKAAKEDADAKPKPDDKKPDDMKPDDKKPEDKPDKKPEDKPDKKPEDKPDKKPEDKPDDKPDKKPDDKPDKKPEDKPDKKPEDKPDKKPEDKPDKPDDKPDKKPDDKPDKKPDDKPDKKPEDKPDKKPEDKPTEEKDPVKTFVMIVKDIKTTTKKTFTSIRDLIKDGLKGKPRQPLIKKIINQLNQSDKDKKPDGKPIYILIDLTNGVSVSSNPEEIADKLKGEKKKSEKKKDEDDDSDDVIDDVLSFFDIGLDD